MEAKEIQKGNDGMGLSHRSSHKTAGFVVVSLYTLSKKRSPEEETIHAHVLLLVKSANVDNKSNARRAAKNVKHSHRRLANPVLETNIRECTEKPSTHVISFNFNNIHIDKHHRVPTVPLGCFPICWTPREEKKGMKATINEGKIDNPLLGQRTWK